jgi:hypothetical protein
LQGTQNRINRMVQIALRYGFYWLSVILVAVSSPLGENASIAVQWQDDVCFTVPITHPDHSAMDTIDDRVDEMRKHGKSCESLIDELVAEKLADARVDALTRLLAIVFKSNKPINALRQCACAVGLSIATEETMETWAVKAGTSKQSFQQGVKAKAKRLELRQTRTMRSEEAREQMRLRNSRRSKITA